MKMVVLLFNFIGIKMYGWISDFCLSLKLKSNTSKVNKVENGCKE